jgi:hypothetical protein
MTERLTVFDRMRPAEAECHNVIELELFESRVTTCPTRETITLKDTDPISEAEITAITPRAARVV